MNFDNLFQNSGSKPTTNTSTSTTQSSNPFSGLEQSLVQDGESILEHAAIGVVAGALL